MQTCMVELQAGDGTVLSKLAIKVFPNTVVATELERRSDLAGLKVLSLQGKDGTHIDITFKFSEIDNSLMHPSFGEGNTIVIHGITAIVKIPQIIGLTEKHTPPSADPGKYGHAQKCEGPYGSTFVATTIYKKGHRLYNEWVPEEDYQVAEKMMRLAQHQAFLNDNNYYQGRGGNDNQNRRILSRHRNRRPEDEDVLEHMDIDMQC